MQSYSDILSATIFNISYSLTVTFTYMCIYNWSALSFKDFLSVTEEI